MSRSKSKSGRLDQYIAQKVLESGHYDYPVPARFDELQVQQLDRISKILYGKSQRSTLIREALEASLFIPNSQLLELLKKKQKEKI